MKTITTLISSPAFWIGLCLAVIVYIQIVSPKPAPMTEAQRKLHDEMIVQFAM
jgi:ABC-type dipeptide/oligopeptide/nickel transport system permease component